jgi:hypothetical protein
MGPRPVTDGDESRAVVSAGPLGAEQDCKDNRVAMSMRPRRTTAAAAILRMRGELKLSVNDLACCHGHEDTLARLRQAVDAASRSQRGNDAAAGDPDTGGDQGGRVFAEQSSGSNKRKHSTDSGWMPQPPGKRRRAALDSAAAGTSALAAGDGPAPARPRSATLRQRAAAANPALGMVGATRDERRRKSSRQSERLAEMHQSAARSAHASLSEPLITPSEAAPRSCLVLEPHQTATPSSTARPSAWQSSSPCLASSKQRTPLGETQLTASVKAPAVWKQPQPARNPVQEEPGVSDWEPLETQQRRWTTFQPLCRIAAAKTGHQEALAAPSADPSAAAGTSGRPASGGNSMRVRRTINGLVPATLPQQPEFLSHGIAHRGELRSGATGSLEQDWTEEQLGQLQRAHRGLAPNVQNLWQQIAMHVPGACS